MIVNTKKLSHPITSNAAAKSKGITTECTPLTAKCSLMSGDKPIAAKTPIRAIAISRPIANAISLPLNHLARILLTVVPAISQPQPKIINPKAAILAEPGIAVHHELSHTTLLASNHSDTPIYLIAAPNTIRLADKRPVKRTPILSRIIPAKMRKPNTQSIYSAAAYVPKTP